MDSFQEKRERLEERAERARDVARHPMQNAEMALAHQRPDGVIGEWKNVENPDDMNIFQKVADTTHGIITPGNIVTTLGLGASSVGLYHYRNNEYLKATAWLFVGRFVGDVGDGAIAAATKTRGAPGAFWDALVDKALSAAFVIIAVEKGDISRPEAITHALQQARSARENTRYKLAGGEPNPGRFGKWGQALLWLEAGGIVTSKAADERGLGKTARKLRDATEIVKHGAIILNERAADEYQDRRISHIAAQADASQSN